MSHRLAGVLTAVALGIPAVTAAAPAPPACVEAAEAVPGMVVPGRVPAGLTVLLPADGWTTAWAEDAAELAKRDRGLVLVADADLAVETVLDVVEACELERVAVLSESGSGTAALALAGTGVVDVWFVLDPTFDVVGAALGGAEVTGLGGLVAFAGLAGQPAMHALTADVRARDIPAESYVVTGHGPGSTERDTGELTPYARLQTWWEQGTVSCAHGIGDSTLDLVVAPGCAP